MGAMNFKIGKASEFHIRTWTDRLKNAPVYSSFRFVGPTLLLLVMSAGFISAGARAQGASSAAPQSFISPTIEIRPGQLGALKLGDAATRALTAAHPNFKIFAAQDFTRDIQELYRAPLAEAKKGAPINCETSAPPANRTLPMAVIGDFNGDGIDDAAVMGTDGIFQFTIALISGADGYHALVVEKTKWIPQAASNPGTSPGTPAGLTIMLDLVESKSKAARNPYLKKCVPSAVKRFANDALLISEFGSNDNRLYHWQKNSFVLYEP